MQVAYNISCIAVLFFLFSGFSADPKITKNSGTSIQSPAPLAPPPGNGPFLWGASPFQDSLWAVDTSNWSIVAHVGPTLAGFTITGINSLAWDHCAHETYCVLKLSGVSGRVLAKIDLESGVCTQIGNLGDNFSTITFRGDGQLFGVVGDGGANGETMYMIDKTTAATTLAVHLGNGADGEILSYNFTDGFFYHWSGNGTVVYEKVQSSPPYTVTDIPISGSTHGETFGALYLGNSTFIISTIQSTFNYCTAAGGWGAQFGANPDDLRGLVMPPYFSVSNTNINVNQTVTWTYAGLSFDTLIYHWGDGAHDTLFTPANKTHTYTSCGTFNSYVVFKNNCNPADTFASAVVTVSNCMGSPPQITCPGNISDFAIPGNCGKVITYTVTASGGTNPLTLTQIDGTGLTSGQIFPVGVTTQTWKVTDANGATATCSFTITIIDNQNPIITGCPSNIVKNTDPGVCNTTATWVAPTASDNCPGVSFTSNFAPGSTFSKGVTTVNYTATDASNNKTTCTFTVTVNDNQMPVINGCPGNIAQNTDANQCFATVNWVAPTASDNCMISSFTTNKNPGATFNVGMTTVTYTATDMSGNTKTCSFTVTVTDAQLPTINCPGNAMRNTAAGLCKYTVSGAEFNATASDACGISTLLCTLSGATTGSGLATLNGQMLNKGITTALWKATDVNGNMNTCMLTIEVKDTELPTITCPPNLTVITLPGQCSVSGLILGNPTGVGDNCGMTTVTNNGLSSYPVGMTTVTWKVTDASGNTATCNQKVTVTAYSCGTPIQVLHYDTTFNAAKVKWVAGKCATAYELRIRKELSPGVWGPWSAWTPASGPGLLHQYSGLDANSFYNYQIRTICGMSTSAAINDWFHTLPIPFQGGIDNRVSNEKESNNVELPTNLVFVPNPANEFTTVLIEGFENHQKTVTMFDLYGKLVFSVRVEAKQNQLELDLQRLGVHTGVYLIRVSDTEKQKTAQLMIERN